MKNSPLTSLIAAATLFLVPTALSAQPAPDDEAPLPPRGPRWERFDANQDGKLDETERATAEKAMRARISENPRFLERADTDKDGVISDAEWNAAKEKMQKRHHRRMDGPGQKEGRTAGHLRHEKGPRDQDFRRGFLLGKFDANGDHKLDEAERAAARAAGEKHMREHLEKQLARLQAADADGDGKLSDAEWAAAKETFRAGLRKHHRGPSGADQPPAE